MVRRAYHKLAKRFYGPYKIKKKINPVAYQLELPEGCSIFPVFHISLLKKYQGADPRITVNELPPLSVESHPVDVPQEIIAFRRINKKNPVHNQVLIRWRGLRETETSWEELETIADLVPSLNLEGKVSKEEGGDVTVLDL